MCEKLKGFTLDILWIGLSEKVLTYMNKWMTRKNSWEDFYSHLNMEDITDVDYTHTKKNCKDFGNEKIRWTPWFVCSKWCIIAS